ncbi:1-acyl-sn-glycerol-3-phosphate acyltransferase [Pedobacter sp. UYP30]|uniref:1-acyl-sn-glycerol-3-phosphate acyltransferase n=1 Tax=Pedobacter sp. UYP30 TaxID=1756400 RepID=UPI0033945664
MHKPRESKLIFRFFSWYIRYIIHKDFSRFNFNKVGVRPNASILLLANHFSWWDGFLMFYINKVSFKKKFHVLVNEENYQGVKFLKYLGAFASKGGGKDILETLDFAATLLDDPSNLVLFFPQGKLQSNHVKAISFEKGIGRIIKTGRENTEIVFAATFTDYFENRKPMVNTYLSAHAPAVYESLQVLKSAYNRHYQSSLTKQTEKII